MKDGRYVGVQDYSHYPLSETVRKAIRTRLGVIKIVVRPHLVAFGFDTSRPTAGRYAFPGNIR